MSLRCGKGGSFMEKLEIRMQEELFDVETQASITKYEDMLIAGVPALYRISNGKITEFYFDSVEIEEFFNSIGR